MQRSEERKESCEWEHVYIVHLIIIIIIMIIIITPYNLIFCSSATSSSFDLKSKISHKKQALQAISLQEDEQILNY